MPDSLPVHVNRRELHGLEVPDAFETSDSFDVVLTNHGESTHVHLHLDDSLSDVAALDATNHHVEGGGERRVRVRLTDDGTARGNLKVVTAYGATTRYVDVRVTEPERRDEPVEVDESLAQPQPKPDPEPDPPLAGSPNLPVLGVGVLALVLALGAALLLRDFLVTVAALLVAVGVLGALAAALSGEGGLG
ncbi:DUF7524 family protein [Haloarcula litorea]|uniref:DUF7524 family protein n=1 Tax=Haloarcula litorea TaxID=3032579 RepID=UPI0023E7EC85|nr:hypothetical protein [Halomicroarcula sp. GDY20]